MKSELLAKLLVLHACDWRLAMARQFDDMIYIKGDRIILALDQKDYDVTDHLTELVEELGKLKTR